VTKLLRNKKTGAFFKDGHWVADWRDAQRFDVSQAQEAIRRHELRGVELYYVFGETPSEDLDWSVELGPA
jgi:hypothetical protein